MGVSPKTTEYLKECMADALLRAMKEKPIFKITVNEITENAGVNRSTWFRNFSVKNEAITFKHDNTTPKTAVSPGIMLWIIINTSSIVI